MVTRSGVCLGTLGGRSQVEVFLVVSSGCRVLLRPDTCGGGRLVPEERQEGVVSSECHTGHRLGGKCTSQARRTQRPLPRGPGHRDLFTCVLQCLPALGALVLGFRFEVTCYQVGLCDRHPGVLLKQVRN